MALTTVPASLSATALTLTTAAQPNITSVGTLTGLTVSGNIAGTLTTAAQTNITSVGTLTGLTVNANTLTLNGTDPLITLQNGGSNHWQLGFENTQSDRFVIYDNNATSYRLIIDSSGNTTFAGTVASTKFIADQFTSASGDVTFRRGGSSTARLLIESGTTTSGQNFTVSGTTTATTFTDGYVTWTLAQFNRYGAALELQYTPTNSSTLVKIGANGSNPTIFNAYSGDATFSGNIVTTGTVMATDNASITNQTDMQLALRDSDNTNMRANFMVEKAANGGRGGLAIQATESGVSNDRDIYLQPASGRVGILTAAPAYGLDVNTTSRFVHNLTAEGNIIASDVIARNSGGLSLQTDEGTKRIFISDNGDVKVGQLAVGSATTAPLHVAKASADVQAVFGDNNYTIDDPQIRVIGRNSANSAIRYLFTGLDADNNHGFIGYNSGSGGFVNALNFKSNGKVGIGDTAPFSTLQVGSNTFSGTNGMYADSRVGISNHGALTGLMLATTYNDSNYPDYGLVFVAGPSTSSYNCWNIAPDGPAKGNRLNFHYQAQSSNIHTAPRMASLDGSGNFYPVGDVVMAQGRGIQFVNQQDFADGETVVSSILDDYEEGRFDPYIGGSSAVGTWTSNNANGGYYIKVGRMVQVWMNCTGSLSGASGNMRVYGLPFVCASNIAAHAFNAVYSSGSLQYWSGSGADVMGPLTYPSQRYLYFHTYNGSSNGGQPTVTNGGHNLHCCAVYYTS